MRREYKGAAPESSLSVALDDNPTTDLTIYCNSLTNWPTGIDGRPFFVVIDRGKANEEKILCASRSGNVLTVWTDGITTGRGADDTTTSFHTANAKIEHVFTATDADEANAHVNSSTNVHGIADTDDLVLDSDPRLTDERTPTNNSVTTAKIVNLAVTTAKIADDAITTGKIADGTIVNADVSATAAIAQSKISGLSTSLINKISAPSGALAENNVMASGQMTSTLSASTGTLSITFPTSFFSPFRIPRVVVTPTDARVLCAVSNVTSTGCTISFLHYTGSAPASPITFGIFWAAVWTQG